MIIEKKHQFNKKFIMKRTESKNYRNNMITETKEKQLLKNFLDSMLIYKLD